MTPHQSSLHSDNAGQAPRFSPCGGPPEGWQCIYNNMHYLYLLKSIREKWYYIGVTNNLNDRVNQHNAKRVRSTKAHAPFMLIYQEIYKNKTTALKREYILKHNNQQKEILFKKLHLY